MPDTYPLSVEVTSGAEAREAREREVARENGFEAAFLEHYPAVLAYAIRRTDTKEQAEDVAADSFAIAWRRWETKPGHLLGWLYAIARKVLANTHRGEARRRSLVDRVTVEGRSFIEPDHADSVLETTAILAALDRLGTTDREALMLTEWDGLSVRDASRVLGCSTGALHVRLHRARKRLMANLETADATTSALAIERPPSPDEAAG